jgi:hypothetical protein
MRKKLIASVLILCAIITAVIIHKNHKQPPIAINTQEKNASKPIIDSIWLVKTFFFDFENPGSLSGEEVLTEKNFVSGRKALQIKDKDEYSATFIRKISDLTNAFTITQIDLGLSYFNEGNTSNAKLVISLEDPAGKTIEWHGEELNGKPGSWQQLAYTVNPSKVNLKGENVLKVYIWNQGKKNCIVDDLKIDLRGLAVSGATNDDTKIKKTNFCFDFENGTEENISSEYSHQGKKSFYFEPNPEFGPDISYVIGDLCDDTMRYISASIWVYPLKDDPELYIVSTMSDNNGKQLEWFGRSTKDLHFEKGKWKKLLVKLFENYPNQINKGNKIKIYLWNKGKSKLYVDDFEISVGCNLLSYGNGDPIDMTVHRFDNLIIPENTYPLPLTYLEKESLGNRDTAFLTPDLQGKLLPSEIIFTGDFVSDKNRSDELVQITDANDINLFTYCEEKNSFSFISKTKLKFSVVNSIFLKGNFTSDTDQLLCIDGTTKRIFIIDFSQNPVSFCSEQNTSAIVKELAECKSIREDFFEKEAKFLPLRLPNRHEKSVAYFNANRETVNFYSVKNNQFLLTDSIHLTDDVLKMTRFNEYSCTTFAEPDGSDKILLVSKSQEKGSDVALLSYNLQRRNFTVKLLSDNVGEFIHASDVVIPGNWQNGQSDFLIFGSNWRNEFKVAQLFNDKIKVRAMLDFTGYQNDKNPKFYEFVKILPFSRGTGAKLSLIAILYNCLDEKFDGFKCSKYEDINKMPNTIEFFKF